MESEPSVISILQCSGSAPIRIAILDTGDIRNPVGGQATYSRAIAPHLRGQVTFWGSVDEGVAEVCCFGGEPKVSEILTKSLAGPRAAGQKRVIPDRLACLWGAYRRRCDILQGSDVIYVQSPELALPFIIGKRKVPVVIHMHGAGSPVRHSRYVWARKGWVRRLFDGILRLVVGKADAVLSVDASGVDLATSWRDAGLRPTLLVPSCFESGVYFRDSPSDPSSSVPECAPDTDTRRIVFVGRLEKAKGVQNLIAAMASYSGRHEHISLVIVGDGSYRHALERAAMDLPTTASVSFLGWLGRDDVATELRTSDLMVLPSVQEGLPISILECLACGVPVVACDVGDVSVVIQDGENGYVLEASDTTLLSEAMENALAHDWDADKIAASVSHYRCDSVAAQVQAVLEALVRDAAIGSTVEPQESEQ